MAPDPEITIGITDSDSSSASRPGRVPGLSCSHEKDDRPFYYLWTFDPTNSKIYIDHNEHRYPAEALTHDTLAPHVTHPDRVYGYAYSIKGGWRITDDEHNEAAPFIVERVLAALRKEHPPTLPHPRSHGAP